jgi:hypothetical protein
MSEGMSDLPGTPSATAVADTRLSLQQVAVHVLARRRHVVTGRFGLRPSPGGLATPAIGDQVEVVRTSGAALVVERGGGARCEPLSTLGRAAETVGVDLAVPFSVGDDTPGMADPDAPLAIDAGAARLLGDWWGFGATLIDELVAIGGDGSARPGGRRPLASATVAQLWPEHFDHATTVTVAVAAAGEGSEPVGVNVGASPGDGDEPLPYLYVGPHGPERPGDPGYWNAPFGAVLRRAELVGLSSGERRARALTFLRRGIDLIAHG